MPLSRFFSAYQKSESELGLFRILYALYLLIFAIPDYTWMSDLPQIFFSPQKMSLGILFSGFPSAVILFTFTLVLIVAASFLLFGIWTRFFSYLLVFTLLLGNSFAFALGKIDHNFLLWMIPLILGTAWGNGFAIRPEKVSARVMKYGPGTLAFIVAFAMFTAGFIKLMGGWLLPDTHAVYGHFVREYYVNGRQELMANFFMTINSGFFWECLDYGGVLLELGFLLAFFNRKVFRWILVITILFHIMNFFILNIVFVGNYAAYALFINWEGVRKWAQKMTASHKRLFRSIGLVIPAILVLVMILGNFSGTTMHYSLVNIICHYIGLDHIIITGFAVNLVAVLMILASYRGRAQKETPPELVYSYE